MTTSIQFFARSAKLRSALLRFRKERADLILTLFEGEELKGFAKEADELCGGMISRRIELDGFESKLKRVRTIDSDLSIAGLDHIILVGLGKRSKLTVDGLRKTLSVAFEHARDTARSSHIIFPLLDVDLKGLTTEEFAQCVAEYACLIDYEKPHLRTREDEEDPAPTHLESVTVQTKEWALSAVKRGLKIGGLLGQATCRARDMVNEPSDRMTPAAIAKIARQIARDSGGMIKCKVLTKKRMADLKMGGIEAVSRSSVYPPLFIELTYTPPKPVETEDVLGLVGKGITMDTGGLSIKDADNMRDMKDDMAGAAAVLHAMSLLPKLKPAVPVKAVIAACENLLDRKSYRPGEVITMMSGLTVEVDNTDCEGRLTLADALHYVQHVSGANKVIDLATLTGAVEEALGVSISGIYGNSPAFTRDFLKAASDAGEAMHELPLSELYRAENKGRMADLTNDGTGPGSIVAALFLSEFVAPETAWVHADIAGTAYRRHAEGVDPEGGTGVCVRTLAHLFMQYV